MDLAAYSTYYATTAAVAGTLVGLLFVAITLRYDAILGPKAAPTSRVIAISAFTSLVSALTVSLFAVLPGNNAGGAAVVAGGVSACSTLRLHFSRTGWRHTARLSFFISIMVFVLMTISGVDLLLRPHDGTGLSVVAGAVFASLLSALQRSWMLIQPESA